MTKTRKIAATVWLCCAVTGIFISATFQIVLVAKGTLVWVCVGALAGIIDAIWNS